MGFADHDREPTDIVALLLSLLGDPEGKGQVFITDGGEVNKDDNLLELLREFDFIVVSVPVQNDLFDGFADIDSTRRMSIRQEVDNGEVESG